MKPYLVVCYAIHMQKIKHHIPCDTYEEACDVIEKDAMNTYKEEISFATPQQKNTIRLEMKRGTGIVSSNQNEYIWTWEIIKL